MTYYIYLVHCTDDSLYCGYTTDIKKRIFNHNNSKIGAKYTRARRPVELVYFEEFDSKSLALKREREIKKLSKPQKVMLVTTFMDKKTLSNF